MIRIIVAMSRNRVIGDSNKLIWSLPTDLKRFKKLTSGNTVVMGRKTYESIGKPLPNRRNIIITRDINYVSDGCDVVNSLDEAILLCGSDCFIIGGGEIYKQSMDIADKLYLTLIHDDFEGDTHFPDIDKSWTKMIREDFEIDETHKHKYSFIEYEKYNF